MTEDITKKLDDLRSDLNIIDMELLLVLKKRFLKVKEIAHCKYKLGFSIENKELAKKRLEKWLEYEFNINLNKEFIEELWNIIHKESCRIQLDSKTMDKQ